MTHANINRVNRGVIATGQRHSIYEDLRVNFNKRFECCRESAVHDSL